jgi:nitroreductase
LELLDAIYSRRSVRKFSNQPVQRKLIETLLNAAVQAPSASNSQPWAFLVIQDSAVMRDLSDKSKQELLDNMENIPGLVRYRALLSNKDFNIFYNAPALVVILAKPAGMHPNEDCCLAAQNFMLAAHDLNLGTCWIGFAVAALNASETKKALKIPEAYQVVAPIIIGYPESPLQFMAKNMPEIVNWLD